MNPYENSANGLFMLLATLTDREVFIGLHQTWKQDIRGTLARSNGGGVAGFRFDTWEAACEQLAGQLKEISVNERAHLLATISRAETDITICRERLALLDRIAPANGEQN
jgi:hypothetical protein